jgi:uncharacterized protein involved in tolerance to divalent cations
MNTRSFTLIVAAIALVGIVLAEILVPMNISREVIPCVVAIASALSFFFWQAECQTKEADAHKHTAKHSKKRVTEHRSVAHLEELAA